MVDVATQPDFLALAARVTALESRPAGSASGLAARFVESAGEVDMAIPVLQYPNTQWRNIFILSLGALKRNDLVLVTQSCEIRNDAGYNVEICTQTLVTPSGLYYHTDNGDCPTCSPPYASGAYLVSPINGTDISPQQHYLQHNRTETWRCPADMAQAFVYLRARCRSTAATGNDFCTIMQGGYGEMNACIISGVS